VNNAALAGDCFYAESSDPVHIVPTSESGPELSPSEPPEGWVTDIDEATFRKVMDLAEAEEVER
jgi:hypothetical protein